MDGSAHAACVSASQIGFGRQVLDYVAQRFQEHCMSFVTYDLGEARHMQ
jgi:hypothetical protein